MSNKKNKKKEQEIEQPTEEQKELTIKIDIIDKVIKMYPDLKKDRDHIISTIIKEVKVDTNNYMVFEKIEHDGKHYYKGSNGSLVDSNIKMVGTCKKINNEYVYHIFDEEEK